MARKPVNSAITLTSFSKDLWGIFAFEAPRDYLQMEALADGYATDIDKIVETDTPGAGYWTATKWMTVGDLLFFYITKSAEKRATKLLGQAREIFGVNSNVVDLLERTEHYTGMYSGTIAACTRVSGPANHPDLEGKPRFKSRIFAEIENPHVFAYPMPYSEFADLVRMEQAAMVALHGEDFEEVKRRLARGNDLPDFLADTRPGRALAGTNKNNWPYIACAADVRFLDERQLREYFIDYLLKEIKDSGSPMLEECECYGESHHGGIADYFIKVQGEWMPVEAKLNVLGEKDLPGQIRRYVSAHSFKPTRRARKEELFAGPDHRLCMIADQSGIYLHRDGGYIECSPGNPLWSREDVSFSMLPEIRERIGRELRVGASREPG